MKKVLKNKEKSIKLTTLGFTLIELLAVIIVLAFVALIATPIIMDVIDDSKEQANLRSIEGYASAIKNKYYNDSLSGGVPVIDDVFLSEVDTSGESIKCDNVFYNEDYQTILYNCTIQENEKKYCYAGGKHYECNDKELSLVLDTLKYEDKSNANKPQILDNMIPIKYENDNWIVASEFQEWYDYDAKEWANAVVLEDNVSKNVGDIIEEEEIALWYVWIPRYKYQLFNANNGSAAEQEIQIQFENGTSSTGTVSCVDNVSGTDGVTYSETCTNASNGAWYTHPAFTFGEQELTGFWIGKFEISKTEDKITIKPNVTSLVKKTISSFYSDIKNINVDYNLNGDSHMIKNMEWGAVAYLSHSKYGTCDNGNCTEVYINNSEEHYTGRSGGDIGGSTNTVAIQYPSYSTSENNYYTYGYYTYDGKIVNYDGSIGEYATDRTLGTKASTTGNIYGVYDMSGGAYEYVMGGMVDSNKSFYISRTEFTTPPDSIYYDSYTYGTSITTYSRGKLGDSTKETLLWYRDSRSFCGITSTGVVRPWLFRGGRMHNGATAGIFAFNYEDGRSYSSLSSRAIICFSE